MPYEPWQPGMRVTANRLLSISPSWTEWVPTWTTSTGANVPSFGNATLACRYAVSATTCWGVFDVLFGGTTNFGGGGSGDNWRFGLPLPAASAIGAIGWCELNKSTTKRHVARMRLTTTTAFELELSTGAPDGLDTTADGATGGGKGLIDAVTPWSSGAAGTTWASGYAIRGEFQYELAN
ncbi:hypothetical protein ACFY78_36870 [Streptomyces olindensis]|uniref:hypothetical protein n=1 Tax=Streptomyces olindensis TaxID=358823 RepID=UPI003688EC64